jgi:hypothetical protein
MMDVDQSSESGSDKKPSSILPETEVYLHLIVTIFLIDQKHYEEVIEEYPMLKDFQTLNS